MQRAERREPDLPPPVARCQTRLQRVQAPEEEVSSPVHEQGDITRLLRLWSEGDQRAFEQLVPLVYDELHRLALRYMGRERAGVSMQATGLVNEVCLRLLGWDEAHWQNRGHFFGVSAQMMRRVLVDIARRRRAERRGGPHAEHVPIDEVDVAQEDGGDDLVEIDQALDELAGVDERKARVVELRFFGGLSLEETAAALGVSLRTANNDWSFARAWLFRRLKGQGAA